MVKEVTRKVSSGYPMIVILLVAQIGTVLFIISQARNETIGGLIVGIFASIVVALMWVGFFMVHPNEAKVLQLFGKYVGTVPNK